MKKMSFFCFMVCLLGVHVPDIILGSNTIDDILHGLEGGHHGVINIVVAVLAVASHAVKVVEGF